MTCPKCKNEMRLEARRAVCPVCGYEIRRPALADKVVIK